MTSETSQSSQPALRATAAEPWTADADLLIVPARRDGSALLPGPGCRPSDWPEGVVGPLFADAAAVSPSGTASVRLPRRDGIAAAGIVIAPLGDGGDPAEQLRRAIGAAIRSHGDGASIAVAAADSDAQELRAAAEGALLGAYRFTRYRSAPAPAPGAIELTLGGRPSAAAERTVADAITVINAVAMARDLVNTPPNDLPPERLATIAKQTFEGTDVAVKVWTESALRRGGFGGLIAVGQGSANPPRLVRLAYRPKGAERHVALVGKGITFDSGGLSLKPAKAMEWMKADMGGAAAVLAAVRAAHELALPVAVTGWLAVAENMPSGTAQRPGDVIRIRGGKTVEVLNTDAEGRLVLADAITAAAADSPDELIDIATLTGAQLVALGAHVAGAMGDEDLRAEVVAAGGRCGEPLWPMPLPPELRRSLDSPVADLANIGDRNGGMLTAALFLKEFVPDGPKWVHLDIAGPAFNEGPPMGYLPKGGTGFGVRTLVEHLRQG